MAWSDAALIRGWQPNLKINSTLFECKSGEPSCDRSTAPGDTTATGRARAPVVDKEQFNFNFTAIARTDINPHATPLFIAGTGIDVVSLSFWKNSADLADVSRHEILGIVQRGLGADDDFRAG